MSIKVTFSIATHVARDGLDTQKHETEEMHGGKTWMSPLGLVRGDRI